MEDVLGWVAVLIGSLFIYFFDWQIIDPILSLMIAGYILFNIYKNLKETLSIFLQAIPHNININEVMEKLNAHPLVVDVHDVHIWSLDGEFNILTAHIVVKNNQTPLADLFPIKKDLEHTLLHFGIEHSTLAFETVEDDCAFQDC